MAKGILIITIASLCLVFVGMGVKSYAGPPINPTDIQEQMKKHIEKVKLTNPGKYQAMMQGAGGNITQCTDCHQEVLKGKFPSQKGMDSSGKK